MKRRYHRSERAAINVLGNADASGVTIREAQIDSYKQMQRTNRYTPCKVCGKHSRGGYCKQHVPEAVEEVLKQQRLLLQSGVYTVNLNNGMSENNVKVIVE